MEVLLFGQVRHSMIVVHSRSEWVVIMKRIRFEFKLEASLSFLCYKSVIHTMQNKHFRLGTQLFCLDPEFALKT